jgi:superfamily I DNA and/or RNA helicase
VGVGQTRIRIDAQVFDWVIVDEAARCTSGELAVPLQMARRVLLVGDHLQLRPMIENEIIEQLQDTTQGATEEELRMSDFERAFDSPYGTLVGLRFTEQYRMDEAICAMVSKCFYEPKKIKLTTSPQRSPRLTRADVAIKWLVTPMVWIDTHKAANCADQRYVDETSFSNVGEVQTVMSILQKIAGDTGLLAKLSMHDDETPIGVICMYGEQKRMLESAWDRHPWDAKFRRMVRIDTVDGYQGKENEIVIVSLVRNNDKGRVGHAGEANRCNVSVSRARERLIIVGDATMWGARVPAASPMRRVFDYMRSDQVNSKLISAGDLE